MKRCPKCNSIDIPDKLQRCPFCGYQLIKEPVKISEAFSEQSKNQQVEKPQSMQTVKNAEANKSNKNSASDASKQTVNKKKKSGLQNFILVLVIILIVCGAFFYVNGESNQTKSSQLSEQETFSVSESITTNTDLENIQEIVDGSEVSEFVDEKESDEEPIEEMEEGSQTEHSEQYILPFSDKRYLTREDLVGLSAEELRIARNEIYARHGRIFLDEGLQAYFNNCSWYSGTISPDDFSDTVFNEYEAANKDFIRAYEQEIDVNGQ